MLPPGSVMNVKEVVDVRLLPLVHWVVLAPLYYPDGHATQAASFPLSPVTPRSRLAEIHRGVSGIFIACVDGLKGFPEAIEAVFPTTQVQLCMAHLVRHSLSYVSHKD